ncbi:MAG: hypothetical protein CSA45_05205 [Gammaproteobacteria bacterium]|nr:MAG: hypothetical protein CSA45_05205 [Gammaproteobacteria bacterium]
MTIECDFNFTRDDFSLTFKKTLSGSDITTITGKSGSGKTTLLRLMLGLEKAKAATFIVNDTIYQQDKLFVKTEERRIGYVGQDTSLLPFFNIKNNLAFAKKRANRSYYHAPKIEELLMIFDVADCVEKYPKQLSSGQKQRLCIIQSIISCPELFLFDEAFSVIDEARKQTILNYLIDYFSKRQLPVIYVTHDCQELKTIQETMTEVVQNSLRI